MSILIKGMKMPKSCCDCKFVQKGSQEFCGLLLPDFKYSENWARRPSFCPLIPVPPHGRLIDADALMKILSKVIDINASIEQRNEATDQERRCLWWFEQQIGIAPTILEAEVQDASS